MGAPVSLADVSATPVGAGGIVVSRVTVSPPEGTETLPAMSVSVAESTLLPTDRGVVALTDQAPLLTVPLPMMALPS